VLADLVVAIEKWDGFLMHKGNSTDRKFNWECLLAHGFEKSGPKLTMDRNRCCND
jgi:hypothetical protein